MNDDDRRARFVLAQYFIESGRLDEARMLLRSLDDIPAAQAWADQIEDGTPLDPQTLHWEPDMVRPMPPQEPFHVRIKPGRLLVVLLMLLSLIAPILQQINYQRYTPQAIDAQVRQASRMRVQALCRGLVQSAAQDGRLRGTVSCMEWSLNLTEAQSTHIAACHGQTIDDNRAFAACVLSAEIYPQAIQLPASNL